MMMARIDELPVAVIGAGPVGLAAAAHLVQRGIRPLIFERGAEVGASLSEWAHVRVFSPWTIQHRYRRPIDAGSVRMDLSRCHALPTGGELVAQYLKPLAALPSIATNLKLGATVTAIAREGRDKVWSTDRETSAFVIRYVDAAGAEQRARARAVIDASGTWTQPNPIGVDGLSVPGEAGIVEGHRLWHSRCDEVRARALCRQARPCRRQSATPRSTQRSR